MVQARNALQGRHRYATAVAWAHDGAPDRADTLLAGRSQSRRARRLRTFSPQGATSAAERRALRRKNDSGAVRFAYCALRTVARAGRATVFSSKDCRAEVRRAAVTGDPILVRLRPEMAKQLDDWRRKQDDLTRAPRNHPPAGRARARRGGNDQEARRPPLEQRLLYLCGRLRSRCHRTCCTPDPRRGAGSAGRSRYPAQDEDTRLKIGKPAGRNKRRGVAHCAAKMTAAQCASLVAPYGLMIT